MVSSISCTTDHSRDVLATHNSSQVPPTDVPPASGKITSIAHAAIKKDACGVTTTTVTLTTKPQSFNVAKSKRAKRVKKPAVMKGDKNPVFTNSFINQDPDLEKLIAEIPVFKKQSGKKQDVSAKITSTAIKTSNTRTSTLRINPKSFDDVKPKLEKRLKKIEVVEGETDATLEDMKHATINELQERGKKHIDLKMRLEKIEAWVDDSKETLHNVSQLIGTNINKQLDNISLLKLANSAGTNFQKVSLEYKETKLLLFKTFNSLKETLEKFFQISKQSEKYDDKNVHIFEIYENLYSSINDLKPELDWCFGSLHLNLDHLPDFEKLNIILKQVFFQNYENISNQNNNTCKNKINYFEKIILFEKIKTESKILFDLIFNVSKKFYKYLENRTNFKYFNNCYILHYSYQKLLNSLKCFPKKIIKSEQKKQKITGRINLIVGVTYTIQK